MIEYILSPQSVDALGWTLLHSIWQGAVFAILLVLVLIALRKYTAQSRYVISVGILCAFFLSVSTTFWFQWTDANSALRITQKMEEMNMNADPTLQNTTAGTDVFLANQETTIRPALLENTTSNQTSWLATLKGYYNTHLPLLVTIWFLGILVLQLRFLGQLAYVQRLKHYGAQLFPESWNDKIEELEGKLRIQKNVKYLTSLRAESPMVIGWLKPVVLMPRQLLNSLTETEIYAVLAHELAHIRREDFIVNLIQTVLCNIFFFHPGVWWMSNRIDDEREHCCDDLAVAATGPVTSYAKTLINVSELQLRFQENPSLAMAFSGRNSKKKNSGFSGRIRRLFQVSKSEGTFKEGFATACILLTALFIGFVATGRTVQAEEPLLTSETEMINLDRSKQEENDKPLVKKIEEPQEISSIISTNNSGIIDQNPIASPANPVKPPRPVVSDDTRIDALVSACKEGDFEFVKILVESGVDVNAIGSKKFTPLMTAASDNEVEIVEYLINNGADVNVTSKSWNALIEAADEGSYESMKLLLAAGADVHYYETTESPTAIAMAASEGHIDCLQLLLQYGANINGVGNSIPPLHIAAEEGNTEIVEYLISQNVNINKKDAYNRTALMYASSEGKTKIVRRLLNAGANKSIRDNEGANAADHARSEKKFDSVDLLDGEKNPQIHMYTYKGLIERVQKMVKNGTDVNTRDHVGRTPLHIAAAENHTADIRVLIDLGADIDAKDYQNRTPLMYAAADGNADAVTLLVSQKADVNIQDVDGMRAYEWGRSGGNSGLTHFLGLITEKKFSDRRNSKNEEKRSRKGQTKNRHIDQLERAERNVQEDVQAQENRIERETRRYDKVDDSEEVDYEIQLFYEVLNGSVQSLQRLLENELNINTTDIYGRTPLMIAAQFNRIEMVQILIQNLADVNRKANSGATALHYAALENHAEVARLLIDNNAQTESKMWYASSDNKEDSMVCIYIGATPLLIATESGSIDVLEILIKEGANTNQSLTKKEYIIDKKKKPYLDSSEVMGFDKKFINYGEKISRDDTWSPYKQAVISEREEILSYFSN